MFTLLIEKFLFYTSFDRILETGQSESIVIGIVTMTDESIVKGIVTMTESSYPYKSHRVTTTDSPHIKEQGQITVLNLRIQRVVLKYHKRRGHKSINSRFYIILFITLVKKRSIRSVSCLHQGFLSPTTRRSFVDRLSHSIFTASTLVLLL